MDIYISLGTISDLDGLCALKKKNLTCHWGWVSCWRNNWAFVFEKPV